MLGGEGWKKKRPEVTTPRTLQKEHFANLCQRGELERVFERFICVSACVMCLSVVR